jgi:chaperone modulatory protein CbpM
MRARKPGRRAERALVMRHSETLVEALLDDTWLSLDELCRVAAVNPQWVAQRVAEGLLAAPAGESGGWRFDAPALQRIRCMVRIERDFDALPELAALVADLQDEIERLRSRLRRAGID